MSDVEMMSLRQRPVTSWSVAETAAYVSYCGFGHMRAAFLENSVAGADLIELDDNDLQSLQMTKLGDRKKMLRAIAELKGGGGTGSGPSSKGNSIKDTSAFSDASSDSSTTAEGDIVVVKCQYKDDIRALRLKNSEDRTLRGFKHKLKKEYGRRFDVFYRDEDGDRLSIKKEEDFKLFLKQKRKKVELRSSSSSSSSKEGDTVLKREETALLQNLVDGMVVIDKRGNILFINNAAERVWGWKTSELEGKNVKVLMPEEFARDHDRYLKNYLTTHQAKIIGKGRKVTALTKDGARKPVYLTISEMKTSSRHTFTATVQELRAEDATGESDGANSTSSYMLLENILDAAVVINETGTVQFLNRKALAMFGYASSEVIGRNIKMLMPPPFCDEHDSYLRNYANGAPAKVIGSGRNLVAQTKDGSIVQMHLSLTEQKMGGARRLFTGIIRPIVEESSKSMLQQEREVLETLVVPAVIIDQNCIINGFNKQAQELFGYSPNDVLGKNVKMLMPAEHATKHDGYVKSFVANPNKHSRVVGVGRKLVALAKDGTTIPILLSVTTKTDGTKRIFTAIVQRT